MSYRPLLLEALRHIEQAGRLAVARGGRMPIIIVGGSAVELHIGGEIISGDIDLCEVDEALEVALLEVGFSCEDRRGKLLRGFYMMTPHGEIGVEPVSEPLSDNRADRQRLRLFSVDEASGKSLTSESTLQHISRCEGTSDFSSPRRIVRDWQR